MPKVSIVVINYNGAKYLKDCFDSLEKLSYPNYEVILVDNASSDDSIEFTRENYPWVRMAALDKNYGFAEGNNKAAEVASGEYIAFLNNDTKVDADWLTELVKVAASDKNIGICTSKIYLMGEEGVLNSAGGTVNLVGQGWDKGYLEKDQGQYDQICEVFDPCGAAFLIKKELGERIGYFEKSHFAYYEDLDIGWKTWLFGYKVLYVPKAIVYHKWGGTFNTVDSMFKIYLFERNRLMTFARNFSSTTLVKLMPLLLVNEVIRTFGYILIYKNPKYLLLRVKIYASVLTRIPYIMNKRHYIQKERKFDDKWILRFFEDKVPRFKNLNDAQATMPIKLIEAIMKFYKKHIL